MICLYFKKTQTMSIRRHKFNSDYYLALPRIVYLFVPYRGDFYTELTPGLEIYIGVNTVYFASIWYRVKKRN